MAHESVASMGTLVRGALDDVRDLFREEVALARAELRQELTKVATAATGLGGAAIAGWFAGIFILTAVALGIGEGLGWPLWTGFAIVGVLLGIVAGIMFFVGRSAMRAVRGLPHTVHTVRDTVEKLS